MGRDAHGSSTGMAASISAPCGGDNGDKAVQDRVHSPKRLLVVHCRSHSRFLVLFFFPVHSSVLPRHQPLA